MIVYVLLFNIGTDAEGIHTIQVGDRNKVLMFEDQDDASRYALLLEAQDFGSPSVEAIDSTEIEQFCRGSGYDLELVETGKLAIPPEKNLEQTDLSMDLADQTDESDSMSAQELDRIRNQLEGLL